MNDGWQPRWVFQQSIVPGMFIWKRRVKVKNGRQPDVALLKNKDIVPEGSDYGVGKVMPFAKRLWWCKYSYYAKPDGEDPLGKILFFVNPAIMAGTIRGLHDGLLQTQCKTMLHGAMRIAYYTVPLVGMAVAYPSITFMSTRLRGKDDALNHALGALSTVPIIRAWLKTPFQINFQIGMALVIIAVMFKGLREPGNERTSLALRPQSFPQYE